MGLAIVGAFELRTIILTWDLVTGGELRVVFKSLAFQITEHLIVDLMTDT